MGSSDPISTSVHHVQDHRCPCLPRSCPAVVSAESKPRYHKLEKLGCGLDQVILCAGEIEGAWNNCWNEADIYGCIQGVLGASDCGACICDVLSWLGLMEC